MVSSEKRVVLITGASSGIGLALTQVFAENGFSVMMSARNNTTLQLAAKPLQHIGHSIATFPADVAIEAEVKKLIEATILQFGKINVLICNAGITMRGLIKDSEINVIQNVVNTNFWGSVFATKYALPFLEKEKGSIIVMSSVAGYIGLPTRGGYSASKFALEGFFESLRIEYLKKNLHVLIARPGFTKTAIRDRMLDAKGNEQGISHKEEKGSLNVREVALKIYKSYENKKPYLMMGFEAWFSYFFKKWLPRITDQIIYRFISKEKNSGL